MITAILLLIAKQVTGVKLHHHHKHASSITTLSITPTLVARDATEDAMPTLSTGEPTLSITHIPVLKTPTYILQIYLPI